MAFLSTSAFKQKYYDAGAQAHHLRCILGRTVARGSDDVLPEIPPAGRFRRSRAFPTESEYPAGPAFLGYDTGERGEMAGNWLVARLRGKTCPRVLIIAGREHDSRQQRCEMALGAVEALSAAPSTATAGTVVVGIDGVREARTSIDSGRSPLRATVALLVKMHRGHVVPKRTILDAEMYEAG